MWTAGLDYGTDSGRLLILDTTTGEELGIFSKNYPRWNDGKYSKAEFNQFRQHPLDYLEVIEDLFAQAAEILGKEQIKEKIIGLGFDSTGSTPAPADKYGQVLAMQPEFADDPDAMFLLWKDHTSEAEAREINEYCTEEKYPYLKYVGGKYSSEWYWAKALHTLRKNSRVADASSSWIELCDWLPAELSNTLNPKTLHRSVCAAGHKALWSSEWQGLPPATFFNHFHPKLAEYHKNYGNKILSSEHSVGKLSPKWAKRLGLSESVQVATGGFDAHIGAVGAGIKEGTLVKIMGTSTCDIVTSSKETLGDICVSGICGQVPGSVLPGKIGLEAGQSAFGDLYAWWAKLLAVQSQRVFEKFVKKKSSWQELQNFIMEDLSEAAQKINLEDFDIVALDWINGRRSPDVDMELNAALQGLAMSDQAEHIFLALIEASLFGAKKIQQHFQQQGVAMDQIRAIGGIAHKSPFIMQLAADILESPIEVVQSLECCARGSAIFAAIASRQMGFEAYTKLASPVKKTYRPRVHYQNAQKKRYQKYLHLAKHHENQTKPKLTKPQASKYTELKKRVYEANLEIAKKNLAIYTFGNASEVDREAGVFAIKPSGVPYDELSSEQIVVLDLNNNILEGDLRPSSDTKTHAHLFRRFPEIGGIYHTHSTYATAWAQSGQPLPCLGTTHADYVFGEVPIIPTLSREQVESDYEEETGRVIADTLIAKGLKVSEVTMVLQTAHAPFTWGKNSLQAVQHSAILEQIAKMAYISLNITEKKMLLPDFILKKHYQRKHGPSAYYGQNQ